MEEEHSIFLLKGTVEFISFQPIYLGILCIPRVLCSLKNKRQGQDVDLVGSYKETINTRTATLTTASVT